MLVKHSDLACKLGTFLEATAAAKYYCQRKTRWVYIVNLFSPSSAEAVWKTAASSSVCFPEVISGRHAGGKQKLRLLPK